MYKTSKSLSVKFVSVFLSLFFLTVLTSHAVADEDYGNVPPDPNMMMGMSSMENESVALPFDPNAYNFLVYDCNASSQNTIRAAMKKILGRDLTPSEIRTSAPGNHVTAEDLATHDILIVGWNNGGNTTGLDVNTLLAGITGRVILTGHDLDYHTVTLGRYQPGAETMLIQAIDYVLAGGNTGLLTLGCTAGFPYLPKEEWDVNAVAGSSDIVKEFTPEGLDSGIFDRLGPNDMRGWQYSYHDKFIIKPGSNFVSFELGGDNSDANVTVVRCPFTLTKTDDSAGWLTPGDRLTYTIDYHNATGNGTQSLTNVMLTDYLPNEIVHNSVNDVNVSSGGSYSLQTNTVTWNIGTLQPNTGGSVTVAVTVVNTRPTAGYLRNTAKITADEVNEITVTKRTWWYKVHNITQNKWYSVIQTAINDSNNNDVLMAYPGVYNEDVSFDAKLLTLQSSNPADPCIVTQTIIIGSGGPGYYPITFSDNNSTVEGLTLTGGGYGVYCTGSSCPTISNCLIRDNTSIGVFCDSLAAPTVSNCTIKDNPYGIYCVGTGTGQLKILNNLLVNNGYAIYAQTNNQLTIRNNTISKNNYYGIYRNDGNDPNISNCVIWSNGSHNFSGTTCTKVNYCCINSGSTGYSGGTGNITTDPCLVDVNAGNFHLKSIYSSCRNAGDPNKTYTGEYDIDHQPRRNGIGRVDIGADEYYGSADLNDDGQVNFLDYAIFANAWKTHPGDPNWNAICDLIDDNNVDINDLAWFVQYWYHEPSEEQSYMYDMGYMGGEEFMMDEEPQPQSMMEESELPPIYLVYDGNMTPDPNTEITVEVYSDTSLFAMGACAVITGDASITTAMSTVDCNQYGWDSEWSWDPYIDDVNNWVYFGSASWESQAAGTVGYFKFIYHGGQVTVSIYDEWSDAFAYDSESDSYPSVPFSTDVLIFGTDPNNP